MWMDRTVFTQYISEEKVFQLLSHGRKRILFVENCSGHGISTNLATALIYNNTEVRCFPPNATDLIQPADSFLFKH